MIRKQIEEFNQNNPINRTLFPDGWQELGPTSPGQLTMHGSFGMGRIDDFYVDPTNDQRLYFSSLYGGFWKSLDGGATWSGGSTDFLPGTGVNSIAVSPSNPDSILISLTSGVNGTTFGIYRSIDGGDSWIESNFNPTNLGWGGLGTNDYITNICYHPTEPNLIFVATTNGLYRSDDNLATWNLTLQDETVIDVDFHPSNPNIMYTNSLTTFNTIFVSNDQGLTYTPTDIPNGWFGKIAVSTDCPDCVYYMSGGGLFKSINNGVSFNLVNSSIPTFIGFAVNDVDDDVVLAGYENAYISTDGGFNFSQVTNYELSETNGAGNGLQESYDTSTDYIHADLRTADCINGVFYVVTDGFMVKSTDNGVNWEILSENIGIRMNYNLGVSQSNHNRTICGSQDNGTSIHTENGWVEMVGLDGMEGFIHPLNHDWMISSFQWGWRVSTHEAGQSLSLLLHPFYNGDWNAPIFYDPNNHMRYYSLGDSVIRGDEFGNSHVTIGSPSFSGSIQYAAIAENNSNLIIATYFENIELSDDAGLTWIDIKGTLPSFAITDVVFDPNNDSTIVVTYGHYQNDNAKTFITHNQGSTWQNITYNLGDVPVRSVIIDHTAASTIYLGTEIGLYKKAMSEVSWSLYNPDLPNTSIKELDIMWGSNTLRAATWGRGLWEFTLAGRTDYPAITTTEITNPPTMATPIENVDQFVTSTILYDFDLSNVYLEWSVDTPTFGNVIDMNLVSENEWLSSEPLPNYPGETKMYFKVFAVGNNNDTTETYKFMYTVRGNSCEASGIFLGNDPNLLYIANVSLANLNNNSTNDLYTLYNDPIITLIENSIYTISVTSGQAFSPTDHAAWIDYNGDTEFTEDENIMYELGGGVTGSGTFTVPDGIASSDSLRMRVRIGQNYTSGYTPEPCGSDYGEVEDYWVQINPSTPILDFTLSDNQLCEGDSITLIYTGGVIDSLLWNITDGTTLITSTNSTETIIVLEEGFYDISLIVYENTIPYIIDSLAAFQVSAPSTGTDVQTACDTYTWIDGNTYLESNNTAIYGLINSFGCDSIVTLDLTIATSNSGIDNQNACDSYLWIDGNTYTSSNNSATFILTNMNGCDSIVTLNLNLSSVIASVSENSLMLTALPEGANYQWIDCLNGNNLIEGETDQSFTPSLNGSYAVIITQDECSDTSNCFDVNTVGMEEFEYSYSGLTIYPNPSHGSFAIQFDQTPDLIAIEILDTSGKLVYKDYEIDITELTLNFDLKLAPGTYFVSLKTSKTSKIIPIVIE